MVKKNDSGTAEPEKPKNENKFSIESHTDGDFRFGKKVLERFAFGNKTKLKVKILKLVKGQSVMLEISKVNFNKPK